jgi:hypothetical protein
MAAVLESGREKSEALYITGERCAFCAPAWLLMNGRWRYWAGKAVLALGKWEY